MAIRLFKDHNIVITIQCLEEWKTSKLNIFTSYLKRKHFISVTKAIFYCFLEPWVQNRAKHKVVLFGENLVGT